MLLFLLLSGPIGVHISGSGPAIPPEHFKDWGACPFECCTYQVWTVKGPYRLMKAPSLKSPILAEYSNKKRVRALTGVVITKKNGIIKILKPMKLGGDNGIALSTGMLVYSLHYAGKGFFTFWVKGKKIVAEEIDPRLVANKTQDYYLVLSESDYDWWAKIKTSDGKTGWILVESQFGNTDACS